MSNPFDVIDSRLSNIESLLLDIKHQRIEIQSRSSDKEEDEILNVRQASNLLKLAIPTIYSLTSNRILPHSKRGKKLYFSRAELTSWIMSGKRRSISELKTIAKQNS